MERALVNPRALRAEALLLLASIIWGFAFVAQRAAMADLGPFLFNGLRFGIGALTLLPWIRRALGPPTSAPDSARDRSWSGGALAGVLLFGGASFQQAGMVSTTAGKAGFITALYVVLVPLLGFFVRHRPSASVWIGVGCCVAGLFLLCIQESLRIVPGDGLVLGATLFWALHILIVGSLTPRIRLLPFACAQFATCAVLCLAVALIAENIEWTSIQRAWAPLLYAGVLSTGVAFTLQILGQRGTPPSHAAIILALESLFAAIGGALLLEERMTARQLLGGALMLCGVVASQWRPPQSTTTTRRDVVPESSRARRT
jgi:drug/metabolite transporter (DMT)-like permease